LGYSFMSSCYEEVGNDYKEDEIMIFTLVNAFAAPEEKLIYSF